jgi:hemolysin activation/secretion protein
MGCKSGTITTIALCMWACLCLTVSAADEPASSSEPPEQYFDMFELRVLGNTRLPQREIEVWLYQYLGPHKTLADVEKARKTLETLYHERGFGTVYVDVPEQRIDSDGVVRLAVTEAKLNQVHVSGARYFSNREIKSALPEAKVGTAPSLTKLQQQVAELNLQSNDRQVVPILKAGSAPGTVDLNLKVDDQLPLHASLELNNQYTVDTSPLRASVGFSYDHLFGRWDSLALQYQTAPQKPEEVKVWYGSYTTHVLDDVTRLVFVYVDSDSAVATVGTGDATINVLGVGKTGSIRLIHPFGNSSDSLNSILVSVDYKNSLQSLCKNTVDLSLCPFEKLKPPEQNGAGQTIEDPYHLAFTPINYMNFDLGFSTGWRGDYLQGTFSLSGNFGIRGLRNTERDFEDKRYLASTNYFIFRSDGMLIFKLPGNFNFQTRYSAQYSLDSLISNEQFSLTGADGARSYLESEILADRGVKGTLQLGTPSWKLFKGTLVSSAYVFYDYATGELVYPLSYEQASHSVSAVGAGVNLSLFQHLNGGLFWSRALRDGANTLRGQSRYQFNIRANW